MNKLKKVGIIMVAVFGTMSMLSLIYVEGDGNSTAVITIQEILDINFPPGTYTMKSEECEGWGIGTSAFGIHSSNCKDICCYYTAQGNELVLDRCDECPKKD